MDLTRRLIKLSKDTGKVGEYNLNEVLGTPGETTTTDVKMEKFIKSYRKRVQS